MEISTVRVQGFRCVEDLEVDFHALTALVGAGGVGKSTILRALKWFFDDTGMDEDDLHLPQGQGAEPVEEFRVTVSFKSLNDADRAVLARYGRGETTTFTRIGRPGEKSKLSGKALICEDFIPIRAETDGRKRKKLFAELVRERGAQFGFSEPAPKRVDEAELMMEEFERANPKRCVEANDDAGHLFGAVGGPKLRDRFDYVLVGATLDAGAAMGGGRDSALSRLLSDLGELPEATEAEVERLQAEVEAKMQELISDARAPDLVRIGDSITEKVQSYVPGARVELTDEITGIDRPRPRVTARVREGDGHLTEVDRQGHGLQRALVIGVLQALADSDAGLYEAEGGDGEPKALMLAIEEPELYQHPLQARTLASALRTLSNSPSEEKPRALQVAYSTHSAHFVRPALFEDMRIMRRGASLTSTLSAGNAEEVAGILTAAGLESDPPGKMRKTVAKSLEEAVFARAVLLCEGPTDAALLEAVAELDGGFDPLGIAVAPIWGKSILPLAHAILRQLDIPTYLFFDGDIGIEARLAKRKSLSEEERQVQIENAEGKNRDLLRLCGAAEEPWPQRGVREGWANFYDNVEVDLDEIWPSFAKARSQVANELGIGSKSDEVYRQAVAAADDSPPQFLLDVVAKVKGMA